MTKRMTMRLVYLAAAIGMLVYAVPRLPIGDGWTLPTVFGAAWLLFALAIIATHLHAVLRVDEAADERMDRIRKHRRRQLVRLFERRLVRRGGN